MRKIFFYIVVCIGLQNIAMAQDSTVVEKPKIVQEIEYDKTPATPLKFDTDQIENYTAQEEFDYVEEEAPDNIWTRFKAWINDIWRQFINWILQGEEATGFFGFLVRALPYLLIAGVVALLVWLFMKVDLGGSPLKGPDLNKVILTDEQEIIENQNIDELIEAALREKNYRLAVRFYYLLLLQKLAQKELIDWEVQKTNADYVYELKDAGLRNTFTRLTRVYDFIWYGNFEVNETDFAKAETEFKKSINTL
ncbi:DUF4129 domain-containing protein [Leeuwenhoekiella nanhaiensis]|uniref:DUF4129 domain-containing protein n=1 Tax=Leeuwenhoekiella nanhaiensis TaxID=1655491 RepID=A0A2G1VU98_9FLAO|nr:DUF4129 domain-containing protein [Leeuwenhoekiella nanhaiensis]PHQ30311.1 DUF4129 domain-containing protein [Leeuwenhoekiella nanhaiensis]